MLRALTADRYQAEATLQALLASHPQLLAIERHRWLLIRREVPVPTEQGGSARWPLDHLFVDEEAVPTFVETKLATNPEIRREIVGQMLDYAANGSAYWPIQQIRKWFEDTSNAAGENPDEKLEEFLDDAWETHAFWEQTRINLEAGRLRLLFVVDQMPVELQRIVEFLNEQMTKSEVLGLEIRRYADSAGEPTLVPRVFGMTARAQTVKPQGRRWDDASLLSVIEQRATAAELEVARQFLAWGHSNADLEWWGEGGRDGSYYPGFKSTSGTQCWPITLWTYPNLQVNFQTLARRAPFDQESLRKELRDRLTQIPGVVIGDASLTKKPSIQLTSLVAPGALDTLTSAMEWVKAQVRG